MTKEIIVGGGCFWCVEAVFQLVTGVLNVESGYANGETKNPTYKDICTGSTGHAEVVKVTYNDELVTTSTLLEIFFTTHNPTTLNFQGADHGTQYRSCIFYLDEETLNSALNAKKYAQKNHNSPIVTIIEPLDSYYKAEEYHQNYYNQNPTQGYCMAVIPPKIAKLKQYFNSSL